MENIIDKIQLLTGADDNQLELLETIVYLVESKVLNRIGELEIPKKLEFIVIELCVARFNRIGSEGLKSESVDGAVQTYENELEAYEPIFEKYMEKKDNTKRLRMI
nr:MAG TPA: tail connector protein [Caudoviricetes sp.]